MIIRIGKPSRTYPIVTSELTLEPRQIIDKCHGLTQIEDQFREMKGSLATRPLYVRTPEHVEAHLLICSTSLIFPYVIQVTLNRWKVDRVQNDFYRFMDLALPAIFRHQMRLVPPRFLINKWQSRVLSDWNL